MLYETGPWRIPGSHRRARALFAEHNVGLRPLKTPYPPTEKGRTCSGLSSWDVNALMGLDPSAADLDDLKTGYADETHAESSTSPYLVDSSEFFCADEGFTELIEKMAEDVAVRYNTRVVDVERIGSREYHVKVVSREGTAKESNFNRRVFIGSSVVVCVPPSATQTWPSFHSKTRIQTSRVEAEPLHHIYGKAPHFKGVHIRDPFSLLGSSISDQYESGWFQMSYTAGRLARFWNSLSLSFPVFFKYLLRYLTKDLMGTGTLAPYPIRSYFWPIAYHRWTPVPFFDLSSAVRSCVYPDPVRLPNLYWAGEAFSSYQAWIEGALETAEMAFDMMISNRTPFQVRPCFDDEVIVDGRVIGRLQEWSAVHPGGAAAIQNHIGHDVSEYFAHIGHSTDAMAILASLQVAHAPSDGF